MYFQKYSLDTGGVQHLKHKKKDNLVFHSRAIANKCKPQNRKINLNYIYTVL